VPAIATRRELEAHLRGVALRLLVRQVARSAFSGLAGAGALLVLAVLFVDVLPRLLFGAAAPAWVLVAAVPLGFVLGMAYEFRRFRAPSLQDAALALEARLNPDTGALGAALRVGEGAPFYRPLLTQAGDELERASKVRGPALISTARLIVVPLVVLTGALAFAWSLGAPPPADPTEGPDPGARMQAWAPMNIGGGRDSADGEAHRKALGMKEMAAKLNAAAATLRDSEASLAQKQQALQEAGEAVRADVPTGEARVEVPDDLPEGEAEIHELATRLEQAAAGISTAARELESTGAPGEDTGGDGDFDVPGRVTELVPFPKQEPGAVNPQEVLAAQAPGRRAMARRAVEALESIHNE
jgi:hypothetical protein